MAISPYIYHNSADVTNESSGSVEIGNEYVEACYTFKIPCDIISGTKIYKMALYPSNISDAKADRCAYIGKISDGE